MWMLGAVWVSPFSLLMTCGEDGSFWGVRSPPTCVIGGDGLWREKVSTISPDEQSDPYQSEGPREISRAARTSVIS